MDQDSGFGYDYGPTDMAGKLCDVAHFWLIGYVNKQNCRIWSEANPQVYVETPLHPEKLTVWCALWAGGIIGQYFFKNNEGQIGLHPSQPWQSYARNHIQNDGEPLDIAKPVKKLLHFWCGPSHKQIFRIRLPPPLMLTIP
ncbi:hypothetical protein TNCV_2371 [Trichonephila clavipes]|nr:hypothetical protein TNCV_2371 [Trichonephila clavipes]